jgi:cyclopropane fatty-acyl-phospholipid synthase-like methyltransferase
MSAHAQRRLENDLVNTQPVENVTGPHEKARYDDRYFDEDLHRDHWFTNNAAKRERRWREVLRLLQPNSGERVLEIGCAAGRHTIKLARLTEAAVGIDSAVAGVLRARNSAIVEKVDNVAFVAGNAAALPFKAATFDKVAAIDFVEHVIDIELQSVFAEVRRVLRRGGRFAIYTPCATHYVERLKARNLLLRQLPGHIAVRGPDAYASLLRRAGFAVHSQWFSPSDYPLFGALDRALAPLPIVGTLFRFRICIVATGASE